MRAGTIVASRLIGLGVERNGANDERVSSRQVLLPRQAPLRCPGYGPGRTLYFRWVTPGASTARTCSSSWRQHGSLELQKHAEPALGGSFLHPCSFS